MYEFEMKESGDRARVSFDVEGRTLFVRDRLESVRLRLEFDREPEPRAAMPELFAFPVDEAVSFEAESLAIPAASSVSVRRADGEFVAYLTEDLDLGRGSYCFDVVGVTKAFVLARDVSVSAVGMAGDGPVEIAFDRPITVTVAGRSLHTRPEATMTVPDDPEALMTAVSTLGSSIAEWSPERSWPTLRGYPPRIERGADLDVPSHLEVPETGIEIAVPATYADVYRIAPLAFYLGAAVVPGEDPEIRLDTGYTEPLPSDGRALEERAEELLYATFFLDSLGRTEGYFHTDRYEYDRIGGELPFYPPNLADESSAERLMEYLEVDRDVIAPYVPDPPTAAVLRPGPAGAELLPHLTHLLAPIRVRGSAEGSPLALGTSPYLPVADDVPDPDASPLASGTASLSVAGYETLLSRDKPVGGGVQATFVTNSVERAGVFEAAMSSPNTPDGVSSWTVHERPSVETLHEIIAEGETDLFYSALPGDGDRIVASDGAVEVADADDVPAGIVFENVESDTIAGASVAGGAISSVEVTDPLGQTEIRRLIGLLASATPVAVAVSLSGIAENRAARLGGEPAATVVSRSEIGHQNLIQLRSVSEDEHDVVQSSVPTTESRMGAEFHALFEWADAGNWLVGTIRDVGESVSTAEVLDIVSEPDSLLVLNGDVVLANDGFTAADVERSARRALESGGDDGSGSSNAE